MDEFRFYVAPCILENEVRQLVDRLYGFRVLKCTELSSYADKNFHVFVDPESMRNNSYAVKEYCKDGYVLKILNSAHSENEEYIDGQEVMREHLIKKGFSCQKVILTLDGVRKTLVRLPNSNGKTGTFDSCIIRLFTFIPGPILSSINTTPNLLYQVGQLIAGVTEALQDFCHPDLRNSNHFWNVRNIHLLEDFVNFAPDDFKKRLVREAIKLFLNEVEPVCDQLPKSVIHNDLNDQNLIVRKKLTFPDSNPEFEAYGILDLDDSLYNCSIFELSTSMCYIMTNCSMSGLDDPLILGGYLLAGYISVRQLSSLEFAVLVPSIAARLSASLCCGAYNYYKTGNKYSLNTSKRGWKLLEKLLRTSREAIHSLWNNTIDMYSKEVVE